METDFKPCPCCDQELIPAGKAVCDDCDAWLIVKEEEYRQAAMMEALC